MAPLLLCSWVPTTRVFGIDTISAGGSPMMGSRVSGVSGSGSGASLLTGGRRVREHTCAIWWLHA